jgi:hypothetical protein
MTAATWQYTVPKTQETGKAVSADPNEREWRNEILEKCRANRSNPHFGDDTKTWTWIDKGRAETASRSAKLRALLAKNPANISQLEALLFEDKVWMCETAHPSVLTEVLKTDAECQKLQAWVNPGDDRQEFYTMRGRAYALRHIGLPALFALMEQHMPFTDLPRRFQMIKAQMADAAVAKAIEYEREELVEQRFSRMLALANRKGVEWRESRQKEEIEKRARQQRAATNRKKKRDEARQTAAIQSSDSASV